jgi:hypothetical protein
MSVRRPDFLIINDREAALQRSSPSSGAALPPGADGGGCQAHPQEFRAGRTAGRQDNKTAGTGVTAGVRQRESTMEKIALGVSSSISIYKACEVLRGFEREGVEVHVLMTRNAAKFISPLLQLLSGRRAIKPIWKRIFVIDHIAWWRGFGFPRGSASQRHRQVRFRRGGRFLSTFSRRLLGRAIA